MKTTSEVATIIGIAKRTVQLWCARLGFVRVGRDYLLTDEQVETIRIRARHQLGRPKKGVDI